MKSKLRNVTLTLEESVARWARVEAARQDISVSRFLANILIKRMKETDEYESAKRRALAPKPSLKSGGRYQNRDEVHRRTNLGRQLERETGESLTAAVTTAPRESLKSVRRRRNSKAMLAAIRAISAKSAALLKGPPIDHDEMLYDENGLPK
jgi:hypothetical protein